MEFEIIIRMENLKKLVQEKYGQIAKDSSEPEKSRVAVADVMTAHTLFLVRIMPVRKAMPRMPIWVLDVAFPRILFT